MDPRGGVGARGTFLNARAARARIPRRCATVECVDERAALMGAAVDICRAILDGSTTPYDGAHKIWRASLRVGERPPALDTFVYAASEWDERPEDANIFAEGVMAAAKDIVREHADE